MTRFLEDDFLGFGFPLAAEMAALRNAGVSDATLTAHPVKAADTSSGRRAFVLAVPDRWGDTQDLVAWLVEAPTTFWSAERRSVVLNDIALCGLDDEVEVFRTPLEWLVAGGSGVVILDESRAWHLLANGPCLIARDLDHAREVRRLITPPEPRARVLIADLPMRRAA